MFTVSNYSIAGILITGGDRLFGRGSGVEVYNPLTNKTCKGRVLKKYKKVWNYPHSGSKLVHFPQFFFVNMQHISDHLEAKKNQKKKCGK